VWDNHRRCWVTWQGIGGGWYCHEDFQPLMMRAINSDPGCLSWEVGGLGIRGIRDPDAPCVDFEPDKSKLVASECDGDGHYLCRDCVHYSGEKGD